MKGNKGHVKALHPAGADNNANMLSISRRNVFISLPKRMNNCYYERYRTFLSFNESA
ncbi:hypothetical protein HMPREF0201_04374 [Cedecea davisae DSM 4568]|uniref:Uncharacterized protein n=1 Tax=Cedecea davisae DSM 4568 TaxID=566551 RepID=S3IZJ0_9ENTR|nr:hypothetical protein HMPREF0201_04374 [Cedecea davisae DSM 4568]